MRKPIVIMAAAALGLGGAAATASEATLTPLVYEGGGVAETAGLIEVGHRGWQRGWHRDHSGHLAAGIIGLGAGLVLGHALAAPRTTYYPYHYSPHYYAYEGYPRYYAYGGYPPYPTYRVPYRPELRGGGN